MYIEFYFFPQISTYFLYSTLFFFSLSLKLSVLPLIRNPTSKFCLSDFAYTSHPLWLQQRDSNTGWIRPKAEESRCDTKTCSPSGWICISGAIGILQRQLRLCPSVRAPAKGRSDSLKPHRHALAGVRARMNVTVCITEKERPKRKCDKVHLAWLLIFKQQCD